MHMIFEKNPYPYRPKVSRVTLLVAGLSLLFVQAALAEGTWPGFRGPNVDGVSTESSVFPADGRFELSVAWTKRIGSGYSGIAINGSDLATMFSDGTDDVLALFDADTGEERWRFVLDETYEGHDGSHTGPISTPYLTDRTVFGLAPRGRLVAVEVSSGKLLWSVELVKDHAAGVPFYGFSTSPLVRGGVLVVQIGAEDAAVAGFDPATGKGLWTAGADAVAYQSPIPWISFGEDIVVAASNTDLLGISPTSGKLLWGYKHGGTGARGVQSAVPIPAGKDRLFLAYLKESSTVVELSRSDEVVATRTVWDEGSIRGSYNVPVYHDGHIYGMSGRILTCVDAQTGSRVWRSREPGDGFTSLVDGRLLILTKRGGIHLAPASPGGYAEQASLKVFDDLAWSPPSFANGRIYARSLGEMVRVDIRAGRLPEAIVIKNTRPAAKDSSFAKFLAEVDGADDKRAVVDRFMNSGKSFPLVEDDGTIHFVYRGPGADLAIEGDVIGARMDMPMTRVDGTDLSYFTTQMERDGRTNYLFVRDYDEIPDPLNPRRAKTAIYQKDMEMSFSGAEMEMSWVAMPDWKEPQFLEKPKTENVGRTETKSIKSEIMETSVKVIVYLPAEYVGGEEFPVAYVHGGSRARKRGKYVNVLNNLSGRSVRPLIAVFILQPSSGQPFENQAQYTEMFSKELVPFIDENYRTIKTPEGRASIGAGVDGYTALSCGFANPTLIGRIAAQSAFIFDQKERELREVLDKTDKWSGRVYMDWGIYDLRSPMESWSIADGNMNIFKLLQEKGFALTGGEVHDGTGWPSWRNRTDVIFRTLFPSG